MRGVAKKRRPLRIKKARGSFVGSLATNPHEGRRSEYLAQHVLSSFGTAIPIPHQEDTGLDCTLLERIGRRSPPIPSISSGASKGKRGVVRFRVLLNIAGLKLAYEEEIGYPTSDSTVLDLLTHP
jgi:hypothetical protein